MSWTLYVLDTVFRLDLLQIPLEKENRSIQWTLDTMESHEEEVDQRHKALTSSIICVASAS